MDLPAGWRIGPAEAAEISNAAWWDAFQDPALSKLLAEAIAGSLDLKAAAARVDEARAQYGLARSALFPQLNADASGERLRVSMPGGGGYGHPFERDTSAVLDDVLNGYVSIEAAAREYGVAIRSTRRADEQVSMPEHFSVDGAATTALRSVRAR